MTTPPQSDCAGVNSGVRTRFVVFRDAFGDDPVAVIVGTPDLSKPVPVRIHSACLTGDVFGSRRCDCGDQLKLALARLQEAGGGIILYLAQEGRGVGLANKMRTYKLQDGGLDTWGDERSDKKRSPRVPGSRHEPADKGQRAEDHSGGPPSRSSRSDEKRGRSE